MRRSMGERAPSFMIIGRPDAQFSCFFSQEPFWLTLAALLVLHPFVATASSSTCTQFPSATSSNVTSVTTTPSCPPLAVSGPSLLPTNDQVFDFNAFAENLVAGLAGQIPFVGVIAQAAVYAIWPPASTNKLPIYDAVACATASAINMAV